MISFTCPARTWSNHKFMKSLMGSMYSLKMETLGKSELRTMIGLRKYICSQFKPNVGKFCMKCWGQRMCQTFLWDGVTDLRFYAASCTEHYVGLDLKEQKIILYMKNNGHSMKRIQVSLKVKRKRISTHHHPKILISHNIQNTLTWCLHRHHILMLRSIHSQIHKVGLDTRGLMFGIKISYIKHWVISFHH